MKKSALLGSLILIPGLALAGCSSDDDHSDHESSTATSSSSSEMNMDHMDHMDHSGSVPADMVPAENSRYHVGESVLIKADHMGGSMHDVVGTVSGVYATTTYAVNYYPTDGSEEVMNHKWVTQEEIQGGKDHGTYADGDEVTLEADHMPGMKGAKATIVSSTTEPVYTVNFTPKDSDQEVTNHMWVVEDELEPTDQQGA